MVNFLRRLANGPLASVRNARVLLGLQLQQQTTYAARQPAPESRAGWSCHRPRHTVPLTALRRRVTESRLLAVGSVKPFKGFTNLFFRLRSLHGRVADAYAHLF